MNLRGTFSNIDISPAEMKLANENENRLKEILIKDSVYLVDNSGFLSQQGKNEFFKDLSNK